MVGRIMTQKKKFLIGIGLLFAVALLFFSILSNRKPSDNVSNIVLETEGIDYSKNVNISTEPRFDFKYEQNKETISVEPLSLLTNGTTYTVTAQYINGANQQVVEAVNFTYEDSTIAAELLSLTPLANQQFSLYATDRHHFYVRIIATGETSEDAQKYAEKILKEYGIDPDSVEIEVEFSRGAKEDGSYDPFAPVPKR